MDLSGVAKRAVHHGVVTVAIPVLDGERLLPEVLAAVSAQRVDRPIELLVLDSGSHDASVGIARRAGANVARMAPAEFTHGGARNRMMELASGEHVAFLTQDASPIGSDWLARLLSGFSLADDVALVFGPYIARRDASIAIKRELRDFFASFSPDGGPVVQRLGSAEEPKGSGYVRTPSPLTFFTDANGCVARWAWERVPYRNVAYAEDQLLAAEMIEAGFAKVFEPEAAVMHSHHYRPAALFRRCFDEWRGLRQVYGHVESVAPKRVVRKIVDETCADLSYARGIGASRTRCAGIALESVAYHSVRLAGAVSGSRYDRIPAAWRTRLSLEGSA
jgi:rhamnosyltransferase